jgi:hypothetical protein
LIEAERSFQGAKHKTTCEENYKIVVQETSSNLRLPPFLETNVAVAADHVNMVKFDTPQDTTYKEVLENLKNMFLEAPSVVASRFCE